MNEGRRQSMAAGAGGSGGASLDDYEAGPAGSGSGAERGVAGMATALSADAAAAPLGSHGNYLSQGASAMTAKSMQHRKSGIGSRRVSFAATAHVRLFDKDGDDSWPAADSRASQDDLAMMDGDFFGDGSAGMQQGAHLAFQMPNLMSVRSNSDYQLRLSLSAPQTATSAPDSDADMSMSAVMSEPEVSMDLGHDHRQQSFEVVLKGSPNPPTGNADSNGRNNSARNQPIASPGTPQHANDVSISMSYEDMDYTHGSGQMHTSQSLLRLAELLGSKGSESTPRQAASRQALHAVQSPDIIVGPGSTDRPASAKRLSASMRRDSIAPFFNDMTGRLSAIPRLSPVRNPVSPSRRTPTKATLQKGHRDSIAQFFHSPAAPSPLARVVATMARNSNAHQIAEESFVDDDFGEQSMDLASVADDDLTSRMPLSQSTDQPSSQSTDVTASTAGRSMSSGSISVTADVSMDICGSQESNRYGSIGQESVVMGEEDEEQESTQHLMRSGSASSMSSTFKAISASIGAAPKAVVEKDDTISLFFSAPSASGSAPSLSFADAGSLKEEDEGVHASKQRDLKSRRVSIAKSPARLQQILPPEDSFDEDDSMISTPEPAATPVRRTSARLSGAGHTPLHASAGARASKKRQTPGLTSGTTPKLLKSALKASASSVVAAAKQRQFELEERERMDRERLQQAATDASAAAAASPIANSPALSLPDVGSPVTRSRSKAIMSAQKTGFVGDESPLASHVMSTPGAASPAPFSPRTPRTFATPGSASRRRSARKSLSEKLFDAKNDVEPRVQEPAQTQADKKEDPNLDLNDTEDDLMDEHLSVVDGSFYQEAFDDDQPEPASHAANANDQMPLGSLDKAKTARTHPMADQHEDLQIVTLKDFLTRTGIDFMDGLTTRLRRETNKFLTRASAEPMLVEYAKAACIHFPELEIYEFGCRELTQYVAEGKAGLEEIEAEVINDMPMVFIEYAEGTPEERDEIASNLRISKSFAKLESKQAWYTWRDELIKPLQDALEENRKRLMRDKRFLDEFEKQFVLLNGDGAAYRDELSSKLTTLQQEQQEAEKAETARIAELTLLEEQQRSEMETLIKELEDMQRQLDEETAGIQATESSADGLHAAIAQYEELSKDLMVFDPEDLPHLRHEYKTAVLTHLWRPTEISAARQVFVYDDVVQVAFYKQGEAVSVKLSTVQRLEESRVSKILVQTNAHGFDVLDGVGTQNVQDVLNAYERRHPVCTGWREMKRVLDDVAYTWENFKGFWRDMVHTRRVCPHVKVVSDPGLGLDGAAVLLECVFFSFAAKTRFKAYIGFGLGDDEGDDGMFHYPCGSWSARVDVQYGQATPDVVLAALGEAHREASSLGVMGGGFAGHGGLLGVLCDAAAGVLACGAV
ncbi:Spc7 kinetochore protein-domain-containing protein [Entophlyctis helioformis]|nr:Spc7 kinetochore protein-domain-containing protein [Entophlyctis helioformis]